MYISCRKHVYVSDHGKTDTIYRFHIYLFGRSLTIMFKTKEKWVMP